MGDLISRKALLKQQYESGEWNGATQSFDLPVVDVYDIERAPSVDAVEVVRCRDCLYFKFDNGCPLHESGYFKNGKMLPLENDFCSYGERKEN